MTRIFKKIQSGVVATGKTVGLGVRLNQLIWTKYFDQAWEATPLHEKLTWILFIANTLCILTLIQFLALK